MLKLLKKYLFLIMWWPLFCFMVTSLSPSISFATDFDFVWPVDGVSTGFSSPADAIERRADDPQHFERRGRIQVASNIYALSRSLEPGDRVNVNFFVNKPYRIIIKTITSDSSENLTITGLVEGHDLQTFIMSINSESFIISFQDLDTSTTYWATGRTQQGQGDVLQVNDKKRPPSIE